MMKLLLTSGGVKNASIQNALVDLLGKPIAECNALCIPTAEYPRPGGPLWAQRFISGQSTPLCGLGWKSLGVLELSVLPSFEKEYWTTAVQETDALLVAGGDPMFLCYWMRQSGLADLFPSLRPEIVYAGVSAGSMVLTPRIGQDFVRWNTPEGGDKTLGLVDFSIFPHLDNPRLPDNILPTAEKWAAGLGGPAYAIDDDTAFKVVDGDVEIISEGHWQQLTH
jgi:dipeptidase E